MVVPDMGRLLHSSTTAVDSKIERRFRVVLDDSAHVQLMQGVLFIVKDLDPAHFFLFGWRVCHSLLLPLWAKGHLLSSE
ncbi:hypothetical protein NDU88_002399 [Pleurodeles waltl]|uniref:Uncharacterized protein n=1 Tax=Pleurodeles waltl TaxID=8319 RepID=A0AAV7WL49_PLEWA|nr:hypothetical protein NDU88_002399 [Pleurodeles waltl]